MPLEVRQIGIRMHVGDAGQDGAGDGGDRPVLEALGDEDGGADREQLIEQCVGAVLAELARRAER